MAIFKLLAILKIFWRFLTTVVIMSPVGILLGGVSGILMLFRKWMDESMVDWNNVYRNKFLSLISFKKQKYKAGYVEFAMFERFVRYNEFPAHFKIYARGYDVIMERKQPFVTDDKFTIRPDYEVYNMDSPFYGVVLHYDELKKANALVKILNF